ncbi:MAG: hypothetical protein ACUVXA_14915 [Candidatus Jordarchaeum sp.]|uniref:hypothetical protein n=1 Tax=Candidatus Jordarchaeum sp. TaxID=2823881 RepID=UPI00404AFE41
MVKKDLANFLGQFSQLPVRLIAIDGTALVFRGIKTATLDLDFVVENEDNYRRLLDFSVELGYTVRAYAEGWMTQRSCGDRNISQTGSRSKN